MSNQVSKQERRRARVRGIRKDRGRFDTRLTAPTHAGAFLMRGALPREESPCGRISVSKSVTVENQP